MKSAPLHEAWIDEQPLRFFATSSPFPDFPWVAVDDLCALCGLSSDSVGLIGGFVDLQTEGGTVEVVHDMIAMAIIEAAVEIEFADPGLWGAYEAGRVEATKVLTKMLCEQERFRFLVLAERGIGFAWRTIGTGDQILSRGPKYYA